MKTLIELYDERPIENVLATEVFRPARTVFLCPPSVARDKALQKKLREFFARRGVTVELVFLESSLLHAQKLLSQLQSVASRYGDCMLDITGGTDAALFACGQLCAALPIPVFTYSRKSNRFYNIQNADFADRLPCAIQHSVEDCFRMAGGAMRGGRVDNAALSAYLDSADDFFRLYLRFRTVWTRAVTYIQRASQGREDLSAEAPCTVRGERNARIDAPEDCLSALSELGYLRALRIRDGRVSFSFRDGQVRSWLRDVGSVLEIYVYKACLDAGVFSDVYLSAVVDWEGDFRQDNVTNEIDVMAMRGTLPVFISCKTCAVSTEALNELAILRDRFGGHGAKAAIVAAQPCRAVTRHRAAELGISVIDLSDLRAGRLRGRIEALVNDPRGDSAGGPGA